MSGRWRVPSWVVATLVLAVLALWVSRPAYDPAGVNPLLRTIPGGGRVAAITMFPFSPCVDLRFTADSGGSRWVSLAQPVTGGDFLSTEAWVDGKKISMTDDDKPHLAALLARAKPADFKTRESVDRILHPNRVRFRESMAALVEELFP